MSYITSGVVKVGLFSGSKKQTVTSLQTSAANYGEQSGNSGTIRTYENSETNISETDFGSVQASLSLAEKAIGTVASIADRSQAINLATVDTLVAQGGGAAKVALESGVPYLSDEGSNKTLLLLGLAAAAIFYARS